MIVYYTHWWNAADAAGANECICGLVASVRGALLTFLSPGAACSTLNPSVRNGVPMVKRRSFNAFLETVTSTLNTHTIVGKTNGKCWSAVLKYRSLLFDRILPRPQINNVES